MDPRDQLLQQLAPTVMVPRFGALKPLQAVSHRFLQGANGLFLEVRRAWLYARVKLQDAGPVAMPYGEVTEQFEMTCGPVPLSLIQRFAELAREHCPNEAACWVVWNERSGVFSMREVGVREASAGHIHFDRPRLEDDEHLVLDMHSHGRFGAFFSQTDNEDDKGEVKLSVVLGDCDKVTQSTAMRLCLMGKFTALEVASAANGAITFTEKNMSQQSKRVAAAQWGA